MAYLQVAAAAAHDGALVAFGAASRRLIPVAAALCYMVEGESSKIDQQGKTSQPYVRNSWGQTT